MAKRWIIRGIFLLPVLLCLAGWGWSGWYDGAVSFKRSHRWIELRTEYGAVYLVGGWHSWLSDGCESGIAGTDSVRLWPEPDAVSTCVLGFRWRHFSFNDGDGRVFSGYALVIPYWFPLLVSSLLLLLVWRKTRYRPDPATAFPVVLKGQGKEANA